VVALALLLLPWVVALVLVSRHHHLDAAAVAVVVAFSVGLPPIWLAWAAYRGPRRSGAPVSGLGMAEVADQLAIAVGTQWEAEARMRRLNDPYPLPVSWASADASLTDAWDSLVKLAGSGAGWPPPPAARTWTTGPDGLAGESGELAEVLARVPTGRLVVLGEPGAGKTMLMVRLVLDLLARRAEGGPVPILASVASWNPAGQDLRSWLSERLQIDHPALASPPPTGTDEPTQAAALLAAGLILPVLDGLDEIPEQVRGPAISRINDALRPGEQLMATCRTRQYRDAVRPQGGVEVTLRAAAAVQLRPLDADAVRGYLCDDAAGPVTRARWAPVLAMLGTEAPVGQALSTPLMVGLARAIYNPRPGELTGILRDPAELCSPALAARAAVESLLFDAFIPAAYRHDPAGRWKAQDAARWLVFLARHLEYTIGGPDLAWWQLPLAVPGFTLVVVIAAVIAAVIVAVVVAGVVVGVVVGIAAGIVVGVAGGIVAGIAAAVMAGAMLRESPRPVRGIRLQRPSRGNVAAGIVNGVVVGVVAGVVAGVAVGAVVSGIGSFVFSAWPSYGIARIWLAMRRRLPWPLMGFLDDAHRRGVLRQAGAVYQFRHIELQHRLAERDADEQQASSSTGLGGTAKVSTKLAIS
jgi:NACHT domain